MKNQLFIPSKVKVGFQSREDTYTGQLAYVIYFDKKGVLRKETSWNSWRDKKLEPTEFANDPTEGFVLNKGVGGARQSYGWNTRNEYIRVYDPRNFEFEISVANLLFILRECDCSRGKGLEGKFVYSWDGTELVLLPVNSEDYKTSAGFTELQGQKVKAKDLILGASYITLKQEILVYLGRFTQHEMRVRRSDVVCNIKSHVFWNGETFEFHKDMKNIAKLNSDQVSLDYADLVDRYNKSKYGSKIVQLFLREKTGNESVSYWYLEESPGVFTRGATHTHNDWHEESRRAIDYSVLRGRIYMKDGVLCNDNYQAYSYPDEIRGEYTQRNSGYSYGRPWTTANILPNFIPETNLALWAKLESGSEFQYVGHLVQEKF